MPLKRGAYSHHNYVQDDEAGYCQNEKKNPCYYKIFNIGNNDFALPIMYVIFYWNIEHIEIIVFI